MLREIRGIHLGRNFRKKICCKEIEVLCSALSSHPQMKTSVSPQSTDVFMPVDSLAGGMGGASQFSKIY